MQAWFRRLADALEARLAPGEVLLCSLAGEASDFVRLNHGRIRQAGHVVQRTLTLDLIEDRRHAAATLSAAGEHEADLARAEEALGRLRRTRARLDADPWLHHAREPASSTVTTPAPAPAAAAALAQVQEAARGLDLVGVWAGGLCHAGFAGSLGQRHWWSAASFNLDWSCHLPEGRAVKCRYAGREWDAQELGRRMAEARARLALLGREPRSVPPGRYRVYLAPQALAEILDLLAWSAFGLESQRTRQTPLLGLLHGGRHLHPAVSLREHHARGLAPGFTAEGFVKPPAVPLLEAGSARGCLVSARSAAQYGATVNAAQEAAGALEMAPGDLPAAEAAARLGDGLWISNLWYCNLAERGECRITGTTRYACFVVEGGELRAPLAPMRFDESLYRMLGDRLLALTRERELILDAGSYGQRSTRSTLLPGALVEGFTLTL